jgi:hypothetical protein
MTHQEQTGGREILNDTGFKWSQLRLKAARLRADCGDGYEPSARIGHPDGLRTWALTIELLPNLEDLDDGLIITDAHGIETRCMYLYNFWRRHKLELPSEIFVMRCPLDERQYFARFEDDELDLDILTAKLFSTGLVIRQQRIRGVQITVEPSGYPENEQTM